MTAVFDSRVCKLGEGPLWHPERAQLFWFDILGKRMLSRKDGQDQEWQFEEHVSAAGWIDEDRLLIASETKLFEFNLMTETSQTLCPLDANDPTTRSNDGRTDPFGGFWIGTMGKNAEPGSGAIYRYYRGELRKLVPDITIPNAICFSPDGTRAYFADTAVQTIWYVAMDQAGWPSGKPEIFLDLSGEDLNPDGAVIDASGNLWNAQWGAHQVACYDAQGNFLEAIKFEVEQISCPAFGGADLTTLFATSAAIGMTGNADGKTYLSQTSTRGQKEHRVTL
ncbi:SMP-30/gluconolactonase/LRE family protein [Roseibium polysiphoniae]|uniref:SMP-30/gluconolactonase/LRE family protein n=1 Tax=Roseibium polysiphoniae TaxID=2571221 RepID=A0ABR9CAZ1_9HYPH|nr:SMP-30/gluconolactonase/LRE family protein [Roseibium polysiphoniae]MBD8877061.1 SMP-30/gluconolactonase/LRE family protein [Roseibium polysiphoniae]